jgi:AcrR family transcriptional regulator
MDPCGAVSFALGLGDGQRAPWVMALTGVLIQDMAAANVLGVSCAEGDSVARSSTPRAPARPTRASSTERQAGRKAARPAPGGGEGPFSRDTLHQSKTDAIIAAAARLIHERGVAGASLDDVAEALGISKPAVYYYISSKEELVFQCHLRIVRHQAAAIDAAAAHPGLGIEKIRIFVSAYAKFVWSPDSGLPRLWQDRSLGAQRRRAVNRAYFAQSDRLVQIIRSAVTDRSMKPRDPVVVERALVSSILWIPIWYSERDVAFDQDALLEEVLRIFLQGIEA